MPCFLALLAWLSPRFVILLLAIFSSYLGTAFNTWLWPFLGFFIAPYTTLAAALALHNGGIQGVYLVLVILGIVLDLGLTGGGARRYRSQRRNVRVIGVRAEGEVTRKP